eukprot:scaffold174098_cov31-Tisochrysis_lutea.AAC.4
MHLITCCREPIGATGMLSASVPSRGAPILISALEVGARAAIVSSTVRTLERLRPPLNRRGNSQRQDLTR